MAGYESFVTKLFGVEEADDYGKAQQEFEALARFLPASPNALPGAVERCSLQSARLKADDGTPRVFDAGTFCEPSLEELRAFCAARYGPPTTDGNDSTSSQIEVHHVVSDVKTAINRALRGGVFQAASQFNYLEFPSAGETPEAGISDYEYDNTQGPACAISCAAGTVYRNYLIPSQPEDVDKRLPRGQRHDYQRNALRDVEDEVVKRLPPPEATNKPVSRAPWVVQNGYIEADPQRLKAFNELVNADAEFRDLLISKVRIGIQQDVEITNADAGTAYVQAAPGKWAKQPAPTRPPVMRITQAYCSAVSCAYSRKVSLAEWEPLARIVLEAAYEATLLVGIHDRKLYDASPPTAAERASYVALPPVELDHPSGERFDVNLTMLGGGVFGNDRHWIRDAMVRAAERVPRSVSQPQLRVAVVHFSGVDALISSFGKMPSVTAPDAPAHDVPATTSAAPSDATAAQ
jgi:hypothetical protein